MKRKLGSVVSAFALLAIATGAAAVNMKILHGNQASTSVLNVQEAADVTTVASTSGLSNSLAEPTPLPASAQTPDPTTHVSASATSDARGRISPRAPQGSVNGQGRMAIGRIGGGGDDDGVDGQHRDGDMGEHHQRGGFMQLRPEQMALLRVAALAQVTPTEARDAAKGIGPATIVSRVKSAAAQVGVPLSDLAAITDLPPQRGRGHGGDDDHSEGDDDD